MKVFSVGMVSVLLGVAIHYAIWFTWPAIYYAASRKVAFFVRGPVISGQLYGGVDQVVMTYIVLPLSRVPHSTKGITVAACVHAISALPFCIGLKISLLVRRRTIHL